MVRSRAVLMVLVATSSTSAAPHKSKPAVAPAPAAANDTPDTTPPPTSSHSEGEYGGVSPDHPNRPDPTTKPTKKPSPGTLSWIGFEAKDGSAEIFLQSVNPFEISQYVAGSTLVVFTKLSRLGQNTWRDVDTRFFESPVSHIVARYVGAARATKTEPAHGAGVEVRVAFKNAKDAHEASVRATTEADGLYYAYLTFAGAATPGN
jgi:hypothetical protein